MGSEEGGKAGAEPKPARASPSRPCSPFPPSPLLLRSICRVLHLREHLRAAGKRRAKNQLGSEKFCLNPSWVLGNRRYGAARDGVWRYSVCSSVSPQPLPSHLMPFPALPSGIILLFFICFPTCSCRNDPAQLHDDGEVPGPSSTEQEVKFWKKANTSPTSWLRKLPSFISLQSSSSPSDQACKEEKDEDELEDEQGKKFSLWFCSHMLRAVLIHGAGELFPHWVLVGLVFLVSRQTSYARSSNWDLHHART